MIKQKNLWKDFIIVNATAGGALLFMFLVMLLQEAGYIPKLPCGFKLIFHIYCPGCGGTRALFELLKGHLVQSFLCNPAVLLGIPLILYYEITVFFTLVKNNGKCYYERRGFLLYGYLCIVLVFAVVRDILLLVYQIDMLGDIL
ncbi:MAG: DUF2752 domain-containing protein [Lachnospiraceae bacterium]